MNKFWIIFLSTFFSILVNTNAFSLSFSNSTDKVIATIITDRDEIKSGDSLNIILKLKMLNGWHTYWINPGDSGEQTKIEWLRLPAGYNAEIKNLSFPITFVSSGIFQYGYDKEAYFLINIHNKDKFLLKDSHIFEAQISWLACREECIPEKTKIEFEIPTSPKDHMKSSKKWDEEYAKANKTFPQSNGWKSFYEIIDENSLLINIDADNSLNLDNDIKFIPYKEEVIRNDIKQMVGFEGNKMSLFIQLDNFNTDNLKGILISGSQAFEINPSQSNGLNIYKEAAPQKENIVKNASESILGIIIMAFLGGLILNLMPCILPILTLKAISLVQSVNNYKESRIEALMYFIGVIISFLAITTILVILRINGEKIGWGFQMQSPIFIIFMIIIFFIIFLMLLDVISIKNPFSHVGRISFNQKRVNSLFTGLFSVLIASPCTAPFMGIAIGYTLTKPVYIYYPIFLSLAIGYALPFTLIGIFPQLMKRILPKPGKWMVILKKIFAFPILLTCIWLGWVLNSQISTSKSDEFVGDIKWEQYDEQTIDNLISNGEPVFIDFTAKWCITCLSNKKIALNTEEFANIVKEKDIHIFRADWTSHDINIEKALAKHGRNSIPLYVYYPKNQREYKVLPQMITTNILKKELD